MDSRMKAVEKTLASMLGLGKMILIAVLGGVFVFWLTAGGPHG